MVDKFNLWQMKAKVNTILLPNHGIKITNIKVLIQTLMVMERVKTIVDFEVWDGVPYDVIIGMEWLMQMDIKVSCYDCLWFKASLMINSSIWRIWIHFLIPHYFQVFK